jgi:hypothetical protein
MSVYWIDILQHEIDNKLPYWLHPSQKRPVDRAAIMAKHRAKWLAEQKKKFAQKKADT